MVRPSVKTRRKSFEAISRSSREVCICQVMQNVEFPCLRVVVVIAHVRGGRLVDGKGNEGGLGIPKVV